MAAVSAPLSTRASAVQRILDAANNMVRSSQLRAPPSALATGAPATGAPATGAPATSADVPPAAVAIREHKPAFAVPKQDRAPTPFLTALINALLNGSGIRCTMRGLLVYDPSALAAAITSAGLSAKPVTLERQMAAYGFRMSRTTQGETLWTHLSASTLPPRDADELWRRYSQLVYARRGRAPRGRAVVARHRASETLIAQLRLLFEHGGARCGPPDTICFARPEHIAELLALHKLPSRFGCLVRSMRMHGFKRVRGVRRTLRHDTLTFTDLADLLRLAAYYTAQPPRVRP